MKSIAKILTGCTALILMAGCGAYEKIDDEYQKEADAQRIKHFYEIADLIEEYKDKVGHYPLENIRETLKTADGSFKDDETKQMYELNPEVECLITPREIADRIKNRPGTFMRVHYNVLNKELSDALGREIVLPYDPQEVPVFKPNFYVYLYRNGEYFFIVHLYEPYAHATLISEHFYKLQVTSIKNHKQGIVNYKEMREKQPPTMPTAR